MKATGRPRDPSKMYDGKPCARCGATERMKANDRCAPCNRRYVSQNKQHSLARDAKRGHACAVCEDPMESPCYDELDGTFRGWLCMRCNLGIGQFRDSPKLLLAAARYVVTLSG